VYKFDTHLPPPYFETYPEFIRSDWKRGHNKLSRWSILPRRRRTGRTDRGRASSPPKNFNPSMAIVMVVLATAFFLLGFLNIFLRCCEGCAAGQARRVRTPGDRCRWRVRARDSDDAEAPAAPAATPTGAVFATEQGDVPASTQQPAP
jgi:hypothetical protein